MDPVKTAATTPVSAPLPAAVVAEHTAPIVLDLGSRSKKQIKKLRRGEGKLMDRVAMVVEELKSNGNISATAQPIVIVVRERRSDSMFSILD
ncbi:MAG TPA: hypothetical protein VEK57_23770 [Thermoanaerobaculia bacterium]|nr:hypothetical protein [Thermoanaerobaculia bacterium]